MLPEVARGLGAGLADVGWVSTVFALTYAVLAPVLGALTDRVERRTVLVVSLVVFALGNAASALAPGLGTLLAARVATAAGAALYIPAASASPAALSPPERRGRAMAVVLGGLSAATVAGVPFGTWLAADLGWRSTFWLLAGVGAAVRQRRSPADCPRCGCPPRRGSRRDWPRCAIRACCSPCSPRCCS